MDSLRLRTSTSILLLGGSLLTFVSVIVSGTLPMIGAAFHADNSDLGPVLSAFIVGFAIFQIPAGFLALRIGARRVYLLGIFLVGASTVVSGFSGNLIELGFLRFLAGSGWGLTGGSVYNLLALYYPENQRGKWFGTFFAITNGVGGVVGLPLSTALGLAFGWTEPFVVMGAAVFGISLVSLFILPSTTIEREPKSQVFLIRTRAKKILTSRSIWSISIGLMGFVSAAYAASDYTIQYISQAHPHWGVSLASYIVAVGLAGTGVGGFLVAWLASKKIDMRLLLIAFAFYLGVVILSVPFVSWQILVTLYATGGISAGAGTTLINLIASYLPESQDNGLTLALGIINTSQYGAASIFLTIFGLLSVSSGYTFAWVFAGVLAIVLLPILFLVKKSPAGFAQVVETAPS